MLLRYLKAWIRSRLAPSYPQGRSGASNRGAGVDAAAAGVIGAGTGKRDAADHAERVREPAASVHGRRGRCAVSTGIGDKCAADMAKRRKNEIKGRCEERFQHPESEAEIRVDHQHLQIGETRLPVDDRRNPAEPVR